VSLDPDSYKGLAGIRVALRRFVAASEALSRAAGVTQQQYQAMLAIKTWPTDAMQMKDLADQLLLTHHAAVQLVDRLSKLELAEREPSIEDRRSVIVKLTPQGERLLDDLAAQHLDEMLRHEPLLTESLRRLRRIKR
jgi:DNA-binding MarR family transcriptional regulator